jgi:hypothetical protein
VDWRCGSSHRASVCKHEALSSKRVPERERERKEMTEERLRVMEESKVQLWGEGEKREVEGGEFKYDIFDTL